MVCALFFGSVPHPFSPWIRPWTHPSPPHSIITPSKTVSCPALYGKPPPPSSPLLPPPPVIRVEHAGHTQARSPPPLPPISAGTQCTTFKDKNWHEGDEKIQSHTTWKERTPVNGVTLNLTTMCLVLYCHINKSHWTSLHFERYQSILTWPLFWFS